jgi:phosphoribosylformylglycinamidine cyclo-ligase
VIPDPVAASIDLDRIPGPRVFGWLASHDIGESEMLRTFNCGIGMIVVTAAADAPRVAAALGEAGETVFEIGWIEPRKGPDAVAYRGALRFHRS